MNKIRVSAKNIRHISIISVFLFVFSVTASQCFAKSSTDSADPDKAKQNQYIEIINSLYYYIQQNYVDEVDPEVLYEGAVKGMLDSLGDPYSYYMDQSDWRSLTDTTVGEFGGVGLSISKAKESTPEKPAYVEVVSPIDDSPGARAGIISGDLIIAVNGIDTSTISMDDVLGMLRGTVGESVEVTVRRGKNMEFTATLVRAMIENPTVKYGMIDKTGYIRITEFSTNTASRVQEAIDSFKAEKYSGIIIDLRNNGGGLLTSAIDIADKFVSEGAIVSTKSRIFYENHSYFASEKKTTVPLSIPVIVLVNGGSASASEILSGCLKDNHRAYLVGTRTYGKGSVQVPTQLINDDGFKITVARYYTPSDVNIDKIGIAPDKEVDYPDFSDEEASAYTALVESEVIPSYVESHPDMDEGAIADYAEELYKDYKLELRVLRKMIRNECDRHKPSRLYDLDYDLQLTAALDLIRTENFKTLMASSKTLKEMEENQ